MEAAEIDSFIRKFYQLWNNGYTAHLDIDTCAGKAWVGLRLHLDHFSGHQHQPAYHQKHYSASRQRRRERRSAAHAASKHAEEASKTRTNYERVIPPLIEIVDILNYSSNNKQVESEKAEAEKVEAEEVQVEEAQVEAVETEEVDIEIAAQTTELVPEKEVEKETNENNLDENRGGSDLESTKNNKTDEINYNEKNDILDTSPSANCPSVIPVYAIATLENCPDAELNNEYGESIKRFLFSETHLVQNISSVDLQHLSSRSFRNDTHTHTVSVTMHVSTLRLWESPASYVRKHLGLANYWERSNGTIVKLSRIHQK